jgi:hypothetical protein
MALGKGKMALSESEVTQRWCEWRRRVVVFDGVDVDSVWDQCEGIKVGFEQWVG